MTVYDELADAWKREFHSPDLQPLRQGFFKDLGSYIKRLREAQRNLDPKSLKAIVIDDEMQRLESLSAQLIDRRIGKLSSRTDPGVSTNLETAEKEAYQTLSHGFKQYNELKEGLLQGREPSRMRVPEAGLVLVRFVKDVPSIMGVDLKIHGPFRREDVARLPHENADSLVRQGAAVEIRTTVRDNE